MKEYNLKFGLGDKVYYFTENCLKWITVQKVHIDEKGVLYYDIGDAVSEDKALTLEEVITILNKGRMKEYI